MTLKQRTSHDGVHITLEYQPDKAALLDKAEEAIQNCDEIGKLKYDSGDGGADTEWHSMYVAYPQEGDTKEDLRRVVDSIHVRHCAICFHFLDEDTDHGFIEARTMVEEY